MTPFQIWLKKNYAGQSALDWLGDRDPETAWHECPRADWMLWAAGKLKADRKLLVTIACRIARTVLHLVPADEDRPLIAIETTERWVRDEASIEEVREARYAVWNAAAIARASNDVVAARVAHAAMHAAAPVVAYAYAADAASITYTTAIAAAGAYAGATYRKQKQQECADIVREVLPWETLYDKGA